MLQELGTKKGRQIALYGGGGTKAQNERSAALAVLLEARSRVKEDLKLKEGESKPTLSYSIVGAASASVHGRSAAAAKATSSDKTAARVALHMAGERAPVNAKLIVHFLEARGPPSIARYHSEDLNEIIEAIVRRTLELNVEDKNQCFESGNGADR